MLLYLRSRLPPVVRGSRLLVIGAASHGVRVSADRQEELDARYGRVHSGIVQGEKVVCEAVLRRAVCRCQVCATTVEELENSQGPFVITKGDHGYHLVVGGKCASMVQEQC